MDDDDEAIFLKLSGSYAVIKPDYFFAGNKVNEQFISKEVVKIVDPSIDSTFKYLFADSDTKILQNMLNSILYPEEPKLSEIEIINSEVTKPNQKQNKGTIRSDIACKAKLEDKTIIITIEMQIGIQGDFTKRLLKYNIGTSYKNNYQTTWTIGLFINIPVKPKYSSYTKLYKNHNGEMKETDYLNIIEIDLREEIKKIFNDEEVKINGKAIGDYGKEWIKLLGLRTWCAFHVDRYYLPKNYKLSDNAFFNEAIKKLENIPEPILHSYYSIEVDFENYCMELNEAKQEGKEEGIKEGKKNSLLVAAFKLFQSKCDKNYIKSILDKEKFTKNDVQLYLEEFKGIGNTLQEFSSFLRENNFLLD